MRVVVHGNGDVLGDELLNPPFLVLGQLDLGGRYTPYLLGELEIFVIRSLLEVLKGLVSFVLLVCTHDTASFRHQSLPEISVEFRADSISLGL
jgi:hypothetical protein